MMLFLKQNSKKDLKRIVGFWSSNLQKNYLHVFKNVMT